MPTMDKLIELMKTSNKQSLKHVSEQILECFYSLKTGEITADDQRLLDAWLAASPENREAYLELEYVWNNMGAMAVEVEAEQRHEVEEQFIEAHQNNEQIAQEPQAGAQQAIDQPVNKKRGTSTHTDSYSARPLQLLMSFFRALSSHPMSASAAVLMIVVATFWALPQSPEKFEEQRYLTGIGEIRTIDLHDGSQITLGADTDIRARIGKAARFVDLIKGEGYFSVEKDPSSPFIVNAGDISVEVVGTRFDVRKRTSAISVAVAEGVVNVVNKAVDKTQQPGAQMVVLTRGEQVIKPVSLPFKPVEKIASAELAAWRNGWLIYRDSALIDVLTDANRYFDGTISLQANDFSDRKITVTLRTNQIALLPDMLAETLPIVVRKMPGNHIFLEASSVEK
ncbi:MAG: DUF4880 domain-containing protein [Gammaproteobacteria bacterium]|nr:DUF4880 domain-containing protein [Gammaproteobacteria bacterium]